MLETCACVGVDHTDHAVANTAVWCTTVVEDWVGVVDADGPGGRAIKNYIHGLEARVEAVVACAHDHFVGNTWVAVCCTDDGMVCWVELKFYCIAYFCDDDIWRV